MSKTIAALFEEEPAQWGLRGDPHLWKEMREHFEHILIPATADVLVIQMKIAFESLTGHAISETQPFFIERFSHGGMSSGYISPEFWRDKAIPLILDQFQKIQS